MATKVSSTPVQNLVINRVTSQEAYNQMVLAGLINENEIYLVETPRYKLTFGAGSAYVFDGTADVTVPVYTGSII